MKIKMFLIHNQGENIYISVIIFSQIQSIPIILFQNISIVSVSMKTTNILIYSNLSNYKWFQ